MVTSCRVASLHPMCTWLQPPRWELHQRAAWCWRTRRQASQPGLLALSLATVLGFAPSVTTGHSAAQALLAAGAVHVLQHLNELPDWCLKNHQKT